MEPGQLLQIHLEQAPIHIVPPALLSSIQFLNLSTSAQILLDLAVVQILLDTPEQLARLLPLPTIG